MPLVFLALDDTLLDRSGAFRLWAKGFLDEIGAPQEISTGYSPSMPTASPPGGTSPTRSATATGSTIPSIDLLEELHEGPLAYERLDPLVAARCRSPATPAGCPWWSPTARSSSRTTRIRRTGLDRYVADWVISEQAGVSKPNPRIFALAAQRVRMRLGGAWVVGDSPEADIGGAAAMGLPSVWLHRGRTGWTTGSRRPGWSAT